MIRIILLSSAFLWSLITGCGKSVDEVKHIASNTPNVASADSCPQNYDLYETSEYSNCIPHPSILPLANFSLSDNYYNLNATSKCDALKNIVNAFSKQYLNNITVNWAICEHLDFHDTSRAIFSLQQEQNLYWYGFSIGFVSNNVVARICLVDFDENKKPEFGTCGERMFYNKAPFAIAEAFPNPSPNIINLFPTLLHFTDK